MATMSVVGELSDGAPIYGVGFATTIVRCTFHGAFPGYEVPPDPIDRAFARVPMVGEFVSIDDVAWKVAVVIWYEIGPGIQLTNFR